MHPPGGPSAQNAAEEARYPNEAMYASYDDDDGDARRPLHGGLLTVIEPLAFEVVYLPRQIRVYVYGPEHQPLAARRHAR